MSIGDFMVKQIFLNRIVELRKEANITQTELGKAIGVKRYIIDNLERGKSNPEYTIRVADYFKVSLDYLYGRTDVPNNPNISVSVSA